MDKNRAASATTVALVIQPGATPMSVAATLDLFRLAERLDPEHPIRVTPFSPQGGPVELGEGLTLHTEPLPTPPPRFEAVILPGFFAADRDDLLWQLGTVWPPVIAWLRALDPDIPVAASCYGTFVLAEAGLLDGRAATTTWWLAGPFAERYPAVRLNADKALVEEGGRITAGAMTAHIDLALHVLRRIKGHALARQVGSIMLIDEARDSQRPFVALPRRFGDPLLDAAVAWMEGQLADGFRAQELAAAIGAAPRTLQRRFAARTGLSTFAYFQALRIEQAKTLLEQSGQSLAQIAEQVGYGDESSLRRGFTRTTGLSPAQYRRRFRRDGV